MSKSKNKIGQTFGFLTVIEQDLTKINYKEHLYWLCKCRCNTIISVRSDHIGKEIISCKCYNKELTLKNREKYKKYNFKSLTHRLLYYTFTKPLHTYIKNRDNNECVLCKKNSDLHIHHILPKSSYPDYFIEPCNQIVLCSACHLFDAHLGNSRDINTELASDLLAISFSNTQKYPLPENLISLLKENSNLFLTNN